MKRYLPLLFAAILLVACSSGVPALDPTPVPTAPVSAPTLSPSPVADSATSRPSPACGGFHLLVVNQTGSEIAVAINGARVAIVPPTQVIHVVQAGRATTSPGFGRVEIIEMFWGLPPLPWDVAVSRTIDRFVWVTHRFDRDAGEAARIDVTGTAPAIAFGSCGSLG
jgi:hypothetical protein